MYITTTHEALGAQLATVTVKTDLQSTVVQWIPVALESGFCHRNIIVPGMSEELSVMLFSAEPNRKRPYDRDLRWRIVFQRIGMGLQYDKIAQNLNVSTSTAY